MTAISGSSEKDNLQSHLRWLLDRPGANHVMNLRLHTFLSKLVGTWRKTGQIIGGPDAGQCWSGYDVYEWFPGEQHLVHRVDVTIGGQRSEGLEVFTPRDENSLGFDQISFNSDGSIERAKGSCDAEGAWTPWMDVRFVREGAPRSMKS